MALDVKFGRLRAASHMLETAQISFVSTTLATTGNCKCCQTL